MYEEDFVFPKK